MRWIAMTASDVECFFMCLLACSISSFEKYLMSLDCAITVLYFFYCWVSWTLCRSWILILYQLHPLSVFSLSVRCVFIEFFFHCENLMLSHVTVFAFTASASEVLSEKSLPMPMPCRVGSLFSSGYLMISGFRFRFLICYALSFV